MKKIRVNTAVGAAWDGQAGNQDASASSDDKIMLLDNVAALVKRLKAQGKAVVQSHGVFDLIHPGVIRHLEDAKQQGDVLVVTVIRDKDVKHGQGRPVFSEELRVRSVAALGMVDYACVVDDDVPFECVRRIAPTTFALGQESKERSRILTEKLYLKGRESYLGKTRVCHTRGFNIGCSPVEDQILSLYPRESLAFLKDFKESYPLKRVEEALDGLRDLKVLIVGDGIIDEYCYCTPLGKAAKSPLIVNKFLTHELFLGGSFAVANHVASICDNVDLVTLLGKQQSRDEFIEQNLRPNVRPHFFYRDDGPTILKKRYVAETSQATQKLFEINYLNDQYISGPFETELIDYLRDILPRYDLVMLSDFGHGLITNRMIREVEGAARILAVNTQTNAANTGFNLITKYGRPHFICLDEEEARLALHDRHSPVETVIEGLIERMGAEKVVVTLGSKGSMGINGRRLAQRTPIFSAKVVDTVGAGDAYFSYAAPCFARNYPLELITFIGNAVSALAVQIVCNRKSVEKSELLDFVQMLYNLNRPS